MERTAIGIGSNQGDSLRTCLDLFDILRKHPRIHMLQTSHLYRTKPVGFEDQSWFINSAASFETELDPMSLLETALGIEKQFGRVRLMRWGPRTLDIDILFYGNRQIDLPELKVPHPLMHERLFVLAPLAEIEPDWIHPGLGLSVRQMLDRLPQSDREIQKLDMQ